MVPEGWERKQLGMLGQKSKPAVKAGPFGSALKKEFYVPNGYKVYGQEQVISQDASYGDYYVNEEKYLSLKSCSVRPGDILISLVGTVGRVLLLPENCEPGIINPRLLRISPAEEKVNGFFLKYFLESDKVIRNLLGWAQGGTMGVLNAEMVKKLEIPLPPIYEQKKIAQILSTWDKAIATTEQLLANSQQQKKALMQKLLTGKKRFARCKGEWRKIKLAAVADMNSGGTPKSSIEEYYNGGIPWVSIADMTAKGKWISSTDKTLSKKGLENSSARLYPENTVLYAMYASIGECSIARVPLCSSQAILGIRPKKELHYEYLYFFLSSLKDKIKLQGQQGTQSNLNAGMVKDFIIILPTIEEQKVISSVLNLADQEVETLRQKLHHLKQEKKALMQQLFTGKRRVKTEAA